MFSSPQTRALIKVRSPLGSVTQLPLSHAFSKSVLLYNRSERTSVYQTTRFFALLRPVPSLLNIERRPAKRLPLATTYLVSARGKMRRTWPIDGRWPDDIDEIRSSVEEDRHPKWGFVIFRCTYDDEDAWLQLVAALHRNVHESLANRNALDLLNTFTLDIRDDRSLLDEASNEIVRDLFLKWVFLNGSSECPDSRSNLVLKDGSPEEVEIPSSPRYLYCIRVDAEALASVKAYLSGNNKCPFVHAIYGLHGFFSPPDDPCEETCDEEDLLVDDEEKDPGHMRFGFNYLMPDLYGDLDEVGVLSRLYRAPPEIWVGGACYAPDPCYR